jgi:hypothetical protein
MADKTYLEILAENDAEARQEYEPNAKEFLVAGHEYEDSIDGDDKHPDELEDQEDFRKPQGSHQQAAGPVKAPEHEDKSKLSVRYDKDIYTQVIAVDSRFRADPTSPTSNFLFKLNRPIKNVVSVRISSIELPNTFYSFSANRGNTSFYVTYPSKTFAESGKFSLPYFTQQVLIADGNYTPAQLCTTVQETMRGLVFDLSIVTPQFTVTLDDKTNLVTISSGTGTANTRFDLNFTSGIFQGRTFDYGLGYNLGFRNPDPLMYTDSVSYPISGDTYQGIIDTIDSNYVFLTLDPDWKVVILNTPDRTQAFPFAKIVMNVPKNKVVFDNGANTLSKEYNLKQPTNIVSIPVRLTDPYDQPLDLVGANFSFSLEVKEVLNAALYEHLRN